MIENTNESVLEEEYKKGAKDFEIFWLRPKKKRNNTVVLRFQVNKPWTGWRLKDELVKSINLTPGDTISTEITVIGGPGMIGDVDDADLFADGDAADWLLENEIREGSITEGKVKLCYEKAPVGVNSKEVWKASLVFLEGLQVIQHKTELEKKEKTSDKHTFFDSDELTDLLQSLQ